MNKVFQHLFYLANSANYPQKHELFYPFKKQLLQTYAIVDGWDLQTIEKSCWTCDGTGDYFSLGDCHKCDGTGIYAIHHHYLLRFRMGDRVYHTPVYDRPEGEPNNKIQGRIVHKEQYPGAVGLRACLLLVLWFKPRLFWELRRADVRHDFGWVARTTLEAIGYWIKRIAKNIEHFYPLRWIWFKWAAAFCYLHGHKPVDLWSGHRWNIQCDRCGEMNRPTLADWLENMQRERDECFPGEPDPSFDEVPF